MLSIRLKSYNKVLTLTDRKSTELLELEKYSLTKIPEGSWKLEVGRCYRKIQFVLQGQTKVLQG